MAIVIKTEPFTEVYPKIKGLVSFHYCVHYNCSFMDYEIDTEEYVQLQRMNRLIFITATDTELDQYIGFLVVVLAPNRHNKKEFNIYTDAFHVCRAYRNSRIFNSMIKELQYRVMLNAATYLPEREGLKLKLFVLTKDTESNREIFKHLGYDIEEIVFVRNFWKALA